MGNDRGRGMGHLTCLDLSDGRRYRLDGDFPGRNRERQEEAARKGFN